MVWSGPAWKGASMRDTSASTSFCRKNKMAAILPSLRHASRAGNTRTLHDEGEIHMQKITPFLWFDNKAEEAMNFYVSVFKNSKVVRVSRYGEGGPGPKGTVMSA